MSKILPWLTIKYHHKELESCCALQINIPKMLFQETLICKGSPVSQPGLMDPFLVHGSSNRCVECTCLVIYCTLVTTSPTFYDRFSWQNNHKVFPHSFLSKLQRPQNSKKLLLQTKSQLKRELHLCIGVHKTAFVCSRLLHLCALDFCIRAQPTFIFAMPVSPWKWMSRKYCSVLMLSTAFQIHC